MKINEFIEGYKKLQNKSVAGVSKMIEAKTYIPVLRKKYLADLVYNASTTIENNVVKVDSLSKYIIFTMLMIAEYTNLEFTVDENGMATAEAINEYDALCANDLLNVIIECFENDYARANEVLNYVFKDNLASSNNVEAVIGRVSDSLLYMIDGLVEVLKNKVEDFNLDLSDIDTDSVTNILNMLSGVAD